MIQTKLVNKNNTKHEQKCNKRLRQIYYYRDHYLHEGSDWVDMEPQTNHVKSARIINLKVFTNTLLEL